MERPKNSMKRKIKYDKEIFFNRKPLQNLHLNRLQFHKSPTKKCSNLSSSSYSAAASVSSTTSSRLTTNVSVNSSSKKGFEELGEHMKNSHGLSIDSNSDCTERSTPLGRTSDFRSFNFCKNARDDSVSKTGNGDSANSAKTPPAEASVSPEIQFGSHSKMVGLKSSATPVCYGAGHLLSRVSDKRKCRRRGSLRGGSKAKLFYDEQICDSEDSSVPLLVEASVRWLTEIEQEESELIHGNASLVFDLMSSPLRFCGNVSDLACENSNCSGSGSGRLLDDYANRIDVVSPEKHFEFKGFLPHSNEKIEFLLADGLNSRSSCGTICCGDGKCAAFSLGSLSSGNIIQTPNSGSSSCGNVGWFRKDARHENVVRFEIDSIAETLNAVSISPRSETSDLNSSGVSDSALDLESLALSQAKISWRDGLVCEGDDDEFDCTPCLSEGDDENDPGVKGCLRPCLGVDFRENEDNVATMNLDSSPFVLEYEPCISVLGKEKLSEDG